MSKSNGFILVLGSLALAFFIILPQFHSQGTPRSIEVLNSPWMKFAGAVPVLYCTAGYSSMYVVYFTQYVPVARRALQFSFSTCTVQYRRKYRTQHNPHFQFPVLGSVYVTVTYWRCFNVCHHGHSHSTTGNFICTYTTIY